MLRGGWGVSYVHFNRAGGGNLLPINGPQVINAVVVQTSHDGSDVPHDRAGLSRGPDRPDEVQSARREHHLHAEGLPFQPGTELAHRVQREIASNMLVDIAYVGNKADGLLLFANFNQAATNNAAGSLTLQQRRPIQDMADITYAFNGGKSRYKALQMKYEWRMQGGVSMLNALTLSEAKDNGAGSLENPNGNAPAPQDFYNLDAEYGLSAYHQPYNNTTSFVWALPVGKGHKYGADASRAPSMRSLVAGSLRHQQFLLR